MSDQEKWEMHHIRFTATDEAQKKKADRLVRDFVSLLHVNGIEHVENVAYDVGPHQKRFGRDSD